MGLQQPAATPRVLGTRSSMDDCKGKLGLTVSFSYIAASGVVLYVFLWMTAPPLATSSSCTVESAAPWGRLIKIFLFNIKILQGCRWDDRMVQHDSSRIEAADVIEGSQCSPGSSGGMCETMSPAGLVSAGLTNVWYGGLWLHP